MNCRTDLLRQIQQLNFAMIEAGLYLDNQPGCDEALELYEKARTAYTRAKNEYEEKYGPLTYAGVNTARDGWSWINDPWPWKGEV